MELELLVLVVAGIAAGFVNAIAGGGSLLTLPALIFTGLDAGAANATNRVAVLMQAGATLVTYRRGGIRVGKLAWIVCIPAGLCAALGAFTATLLSEAELRTVIAIAMLVFLALTIVRRRPPGTEDGSDRAPELPPFHWSMVPGFAAIGFYTGFLQAGTGVLILLYLSLAYGSQLVPANALKVAVILVLTAIAMVTFHLSGATIDPLRGLSLGAGAMVGGVLGARSALRRGEGFVRVILVVAVLASATKLLWDSLK